MGLQSTYGLKHSRRRKAFMRTLSVGYDSTSAIEVLAEGPECRSYGTGERAGIREAPAMEAPSQGSRQCKS